MLLEAYMEANTHQWIDGMTILVWAAPVLQISAKTQGLDTQTLSQTAGSVFHTVLLCALS